MKKTSVVRSCCLTVISAMIIFLGIYVLMPQQASADTDTVKYPVTGGELTFDKSTGTVTACDKTVTKVVIPAEIDGVAVKTIGTTAFTYCKKLVSVTLPEGLTTMRTTAFSHSGIVTLDIPASVTYIDQWTFDYAESLKAINVAEGNMNYCSKDGVLFSKDMTVLRTFPLGKVCDKYTVPSGVTFISEMAFYRADVREIVVSDSVEKIGIDAFRESSKLEKVHLPDSLQAIRARCFYQCSALEDVDMPASLTEICTAAFYKCTSLKEVVIPDNVTVIHPDAFGNCSFLRSVTIPESVDTIYDSAFNGSYNVIIYGVAGSYAETFAKQHGIPFNGNSRKSQQIKCSDVFEKTYGDDDFDLGASTTAETNDVKLQYESLSPEVAEVSDEGRVTIKRAGRADIQITAPETKEYSSDTKTVSVDVDKFQRVITTDKDEYVLVYGDSTINTGLSVSGEGGVSCEADRDTVAMAVIHAGKGLVTPNKPGTAIVTYKAKGSDNYREAEKQITVRVNKAENRIGAKRDSLDLVCGKTASLDMASLTSLEYKSSNSSVATVTPEGVVQACGAGTAIITATAAENEYYNSIEKNITVNVSKAA